MRPSLRLKREAGPPHTRRIQTGARGGGKEWIFSRPTGFAVADLLCCPGPLRNCARQGPHARRASLHSPLRYGAFSDDSVAVRDASITGLGPKRSVVCKEVRCPVGSPRAQLRSGVVQHPRLVTANPAGLEKRFSSPPLGAPV